MEPLDPSLWNPKTHRLLQLLRCVIFYDCALCREPAEWAAVPAEFFYRKRRKGESWIHVGLRETLGRPQHLHLPLSEYVDKLLLEVETTARIDGWHRLRDLCSAWTVDRVFDLSQKYDRGVCISRDYAEAHFRDFLPSDSRGVLGTGDSGTVKQNLLW